MYGTHIFIYMISLPVTPQRSFEFHQSGECKFSYKSQFICRCDKKKSRPAQFLWYGLGLAKVKQVIPFMVLGLVN